MLIFFFLLFFAPKLLLQDPLSKSRNGKELVRVSIVQGEDGAALLDTLVKPAHPVVAWRTSIHGVAPAHLNGVMFTHR